MHLQINLAATLVAIISSGPTFISAAPLPHADAEAKAIDARDLRPFHIFIQNCRGNFATPVEIGVGAPEYSYYSAIPDGWSNSCNAPSQLDGTVSVGHTFTTQNPFDTSATLVYMPNNGNWWNIYDTNDKNTQIGDCVTAPTDKGSYCLSGWDACTAISVAACKLYN